MYLIDTHTHLYYTDDPTELNAQMDRCVNNHVQQLLFPNVDVNSIELIQNTISRFPEHCFAMLGLHPCSVKEDYLQQLEIIKNLIDQSIQSEQPFKLFGIGEIGLDLHWDTTTLGIQKDAFRIQTAWAKQLNLPVTIHCRDAYEPLFELLEEVQDGTLSGVLHCFTGDLEQANRVLEYGLYLGIGGVVTYKNAGLDHVVKQIPVHKIVLETDSPYLAPVPFRGKKNESSFLLNIAEKVADLQQISIEELAEVTTNTAAKLFKLPVQN